MKLSVKTNIEIQASAEKVWEALIDFENWKKWNSSIPQVSGELRVGSELQILINMNSKTVTGKPIILIATPEKELRWRGGLPIPGLFTGEHYFQIEKISDSKINFTHGENFKGLLISFLFKDPKLLEKAYQKVNENFKNYLERG